jgi:hypothetical protein
MRFFEARRLTNLTPIGSRALAEHGGSLLRMSSLRCGPLRVGPLIFVSRRHDNERRVAPFKHTQQRLQNGHVSDDVDAGLDVSPPSSPIILALVNVSVAPAASSAGRST